MAPTDNSTQGRSGLALDVGASRIGVALANLDVRFAGPLTTIDASEESADEILELCRQHDAAWLVIGLPRGLEGQDTAQTRGVQHFGELLQQRMTEVETEVPIYWIDEALTSVKAEDELAGRGKPYAKGDVDALAATYILEDFLREQS